MRHSIAATIALCILSAASSANTISDGVVRVGVLNDLTGPYIDLAGPGSVEAARLAAEDFGGRIGDARIEIVSADHQNKPDVGATIVRRWFDQEKVDAIADVPTSSVGLAVQEIARDKKRIFLISGAAVADLSGKACSPYSIQTSDDTYSFTVATARAVVQSGQKSWYMIVADYAAGHSVEALAKAAVEGAGGTMIGSVRHPQNLADFSSFVVRAQASRSNIVGFGNFGGDTVNGIKAAQEFGLTRGGQKLVAFGMFVSDVHALGLPNAQGLLLAEGFYWDQNDQTRAFSRRFEARMGKKPTRQQATTYATVVHYLKGVEATRSDDPDVVMDWMRKNPMAYFGQQGTIRADGRMMRDTYLWEVKSPSESKGPWDYYRLVATIPASEAFRPLAQSECPQERRR
jgi:branched-chain amino acid transport system substrate-binding protein